LGLYLHAGGGRGNPADLPAEMEFTVGLEMLADMRSVPAHRSTGTAHAETLVRIVIEPREEARAGLEFGLYREGGRVLERLTTGSGIRLETGRGTALFEAPAWRLVGAEPGSRDFLVAVASAGRLPEVLELTAGEEAAGALAALSGGRVYRHTISVLPAPD